MEKQWKQWEAFLGSRITADGDCSHEIKRCLPLERKVMTSLLLLLLLSHFSHVRLCSTPQTAAHQAPPSLGFSRKEYWSGMPLPSPMTSLDSILKSRHYFTNKGPSSQSCGFSSSHIWMWELDYKESWVLKNWCFWTVVLEKTLESPLYCKEIILVHPKEDQSWVFIGRTDAEAETPILWPPDVKSWLIGKVLDAGKDWRREEKGTTEDKMVGWHHRLRGHEFE